MHILIIITLFIMTTKPIAAQLNYQQLEVTVMDDQPVVKGSLNGKLAYFLIDTGSDVSLLNTNDAKKYGYHYISRNNYRHKLSGIGENTNEILYAYNVHLELSDTKIKDLFIVYDLTNIINSLSAGSSVKIVGIIGAKIMKRHGFIIDYNRKEVKMKRR